MKPKVPKKKGPEGPALDVTVVPVPGGTSLVLKVGHNRKSLGQKEMGLLLQTYVRGTNPEAKVKLVFSWLQKERLDILTEGDIGSPQSPTLGKLIKALEKTFPKILESK